MAEYFINKSELTSEQLITFKAELSKQGFKFSEDSVILKVETTQQLRLDRLRKIKDNLNCKTSGLWHQRHHALDR